MAKVKKVEKVKRLDKFDDVSNATAKSFTNANSSTINSRIRILQFEAAETENGITAMTVSLDNLKYRRKIIAAELRGLSSVLEKR